MKKFFLVLTALLILSSNAFAQDPTSIMLKFSNDTRFKNVDSASVLSDLVMEKLLATGRFNFRETKPIDKDIEAMLYDVKSQELLNITTATAKGNLNNLFEGADFNGKQRDTIGSTKVGDIIDPKITSQIGNAHGAEYIIQGNVINLGNGEFLNKDIEDVSQVINAASSMAGMGGFSMSQKQAGIGIDVDLRIIRASTGEVVWRKNVLGKKITTLTKVGMFKSGSTKLTSELYAEAMEDAAQKITDAIIGDLQARMLIAKAK
jgi:curli biogenesis system outer membrane secretion channel CsgG